MKIPRSDQYTIHAYWGPRRETPEALAARFLNLLGRLSRIDPVFGHWIWTGAPRKPIAFEDLRNRLPVAVEASIVCGDNGEPIPIYGYNFGVINSMKFQPRAISVRIRAGSWSVAGHIINDAEINTPWRVVPDPAIVTFPIFKAAVLALAESFDATSCFAYPFEIMNFWKDSVPPYRLAWISYVGPRFAPLITPPAKAIVERHPHGGLLMAATDETFVTSNPAHLAVANDILAAVAPLNALPWPPEIKAAPLGM
jgi:hypothetical protein